MEEKRNCGNCAFCRKIKYGIGYIPEENWTVKLTCMEHPDVVNDVIAGPMKVSEDYCCEFHMFKDERDDWETRMDRKKYDDCKRLIAELEKKHPEFKTGKAGPRKEMTRYEIAMYIIRNRTAPAGYEIDWLSNGKPGILFEDRVPGDSVHFSREDVPVPETLLMTGTIIIDLNRLLSWDDNPKKKLEFGRVTIPTEFQVSALTFVYDGKDAGKLAAWWDKVYSAEIRNLMKKDVVFDMKYVWNGAKTDVYSVLMKEVTYPEKDGDKVVANLVCDWLHRDCYDE